MDFPEQAEDIYDTRATKKALELLKKRTESEVKIAA
jgi:hypothetical protein